MCKKYCGSQWLCKTCCYLDLEKLLSFLLLQSEDWVKTQARKDVGRCYSFWLWDFYLGKYDQSKISEAWMNPRGKGKKEGKRKKSLHLVATQYTFLPCWFARIPGQRRGSSPRERCSDFSLTTALPDPGEFLCVQSLPPTCPPKQVTVGSSLALYPEHR